MTTVRNTLLLLALALAQQTTHLVGAQCAQTKHKRSAQTFIASASSSSASAETTNSTSSCKQAATLTTVELAELIALLAQLKNEQLEIATPHTPIPKSTAKRESTYGALLPDGKHFLRSEGKKILVMRVEGKTVKCVYELELNDAKIHGITIMINVDGKFVPLDKSNEKLVAKDWHNCILVTNDWSNSVETTPLKQVCKDLAILESLEKNTSVRCYRIPTQGSGSCFTLEHLQ